MIFNSQSDIDLLVSKFVDKTLPIAEWTHQAHLTVAVWHLYHFNVEKSLILLRARIITYNMATGCDNSEIKGYHETITVFWLFFIQKFINIDKNLGLLGLVNKLITSEAASFNILFSYYSKELLFSEKARALWVEPDLKPLD